MSMTSKPPSETLPRIGTVENPAMFSDGENVLLCYEVAPIDGGGNVILEFEDVFHFEQNPMNVEGLGKSQYPVQAWSFCEVLGSKRTERWKMLGPRFWVISFNDVTVEIVFKAIRIAHRNTSKTRPSEALKAFVQATDVPR